MEAVQILSDPVAKLESYLLQMPQVGLQTSHVVHGRMYARTIFIPAGTALTGTLTNCDNICVLQGDITVTTDEGMRRLTGFHVLPAKAGYKRAGVAHADTWWTTVFQTDKIEITEIEDEMTNESHLLQTRREGIEYAPRALEIAT
jgi:hypothetical protein